MLIGAGLVAIERWAYCSRRSKNVEQEEDGRGMEVKGLEIDCVLEYWTI